MTPDELLALRVSAIAGQVTRDHDWSTVSQPSPQTPIARWRWLWRLGSVGGAIQSVKGSIYRGIPEDSGLGAKG